MTPSVRRDKKLCRTKFRTIDGVAYRKFANGSRLRKGAVAGSGGAIATGRRVLRWGSARQGRAATPSGVGTTPTGDRALCTYVMWLGALAQKRVKNLPMARPVQ